MAIKTTSGFNSDREAKPEVEIWWRPKNQLFDPDFIFTPSDCFSCFRHNTKRHRQTEDKQTTQCAKSARPIVLSAKMVKISVFWQAVFYPQWQQYILTKVKFVTEA